MCIILRGKYNYRVCDIVYAVGLEIIGIRLPKRERKEKKGMCVRFLWTFLSIYGVDP